MEELQSHSDFGRRVLLDPCMGLARSGYGFSCLGVSLIGGQLGL
jgi:hypothetical protein